MSSLFLTITTASLDQAISDLAAKLSDLQDGTELAQKHFEQLIGSDDHPEISKKEKIARLSAVHAELSKTKEMIQNEQSSNELSEEAVIVLSSYEEVTKRPRLEVEHQPLEPGIPSAHLIWAANVARGKLAQLLEAIICNLEPPEETFLGLFMDYRQELGHEAFARENDTWFVYAVMSYLETIIENPQAAWVGAIEVPVVVKQHVLDPHLALAKKNLRIH